MHKFLAIIGVFSIFWAFSAKAEPEMYDFDQGHTRILFFVNHAGFSDVIGEFTEYGGYFMFDKDKPEESYVTITINPSSVDTRHGGLNDHLRGKDFFNTPVYNSINFVSTKIEKTGENTGKLTGDLTLLGVTKPLTFDVNFNKQDEFFGRMHVGFSLKAKLKRSDFSMDCKIPLIGDEISILVQAEGTKRQND